MVDHEIPTKENFSSPSDDILPLGWKLRLNEEHDFLKFIKKDHVPHTKLLRSISPHDEKRSALKKEDVARICDDLSGIIFNLLKHSSAEYKNTSTAKVIKRVEIAYKSNMEKFLMKTDDIILSARNMRNKLIKSLREFLLISRGTACIILGSSVANFAVVIGSLMHKIFGFAWNSQKFLNPTITGALTFTASLMTFTYMNQTTNDFSKDMRKEIRLLRDLSAIHKKGDWLDEEVSKLFPYGIDLNLIDFESTNYYKKKPEWKEYLCSRIILGNIERDKKLLKNEDFLIKVKLFVENPAAEIWWSRMRIKKLLEGIDQKANQISSKEFLSSHESVIYRTALCIYPVIIPWLFLTRAPEEMKFIFATLGGFLSALELKNDGSEELDNLKKMYSIFEKDFKEIYKICEILDGDED